MFQVFAAEMFGQRVLAAYKEKVCHILEYENMNPSCSIRE